MEFNVKTKELLKKAGWKEGRKLDISKLNLPYNDYPDFIKDFLKEYGNLYGDCETIKLPYSESTNKFDTEPAMPNDLLNGDNTFPYYQSIIGKKLFPIGGYYPDGYNICCDADGRVYMIGEYCYYRGKNLYEGIENILLGWENCFQLDEKTGKWWNDDAEYVELPPL